MATNVSERIHTLQDVLDALSQQASAGYATASARSVDDR